MRPYTDLPELRAVLLEESYVLRVEATPGLLAFSMEFVLTDEHPEYEPPDADTYLRYRRGTLTFSGVSRLSWTDQGARPSHDATGELDFGQIDFMRFDGERVELGGDIGQFALAAARIDVVLTPDRPG